MTPTISITVMTLFIFHNLRTVTLSRHFFDFKPHKNKDKKNNKMTLITENMFIIEDVYSRSVDEVIRSGQKLASHHWPINVY